jgi:hypothetical protein
VPGPSFGLVLLEAESPGGGSAGATSLIFPKIHSQECVKKSVPEGVASRPLFAVFGFRARALEGVQAVRLDLSEGRPGTAPAVRHRHVCVQRRYAATNLYQGKFASVFCHWCP